MGKPLERGKAKGDMVLAAGLEMTLAAVVWSRV